MTRKAVVAALIALAAVPALAHNPPFVYRPKPPPPTTNLGMAQQYQDEASRWRAEAAHYRQMAADYKKFSKSPVNPQIPKFQQHYLAVANAADQRAMNAEARAKEYRSRATRD